MLEIGKKHELIHFIQLKSTTLNKDKIKCKFVRFFLWNLEHFIMNDIIKVPQVERRQLILFWKWKVVQMWDKEKVGRFHEHEEMHNKLG